MRKLLLATAVLLLAGCQTWGPTWSEVTGQRWNLNNVNTAPAIIQQIDGSSPFPNTVSQAIKTEPGPHAILMSAVPLSAGWVGGTDLVTMKITLEACKRYYINAHYENPLGPQWTPFVDYVEPIAGCTVAPPAK